MSPTPSACSPLIFALTALTAAFGGSACSSDPALTTGSVGASSGSLASATAAGSGGAAATTTTAGSTAGSSGSGSVGANAGSGAGGAAIACAAGTALALADLGADVPDGAGTAESVITVGNVGGTGTYPRVVSMNPGTFGQPCPTDACVKQDAKVSGPLAPFDEELTVNLRGPLELYDFAVYTPSGASWARVSSWNRCAAGNVAFLDNKGGGKSGEWTTCGGNSQSYASADGNDSAAGPTSFAGTLENGVELNVLSAQGCSGQGDASECGFYRGVAMHGWSGAKVFAMRTRMPRFTGATGTAYTDEPAIWMLNARIVRTAQYGCNCRGVGSPGGCGEIDVAEVLKGNHLTHATSTIYSFQGAIGADGASGAGHYFLRPVNKSATFIVVFDASGKIQMRREAADAFDFAPSLDGAVVAEWVAKSGFAMALP